MREIVISGPLLALVLMGAPAGAADVVGPGYGQLQADQNTSLLTQLAHGEDWQPIGCISNAHACHDHAHEHGYQFSRLVYDHGECENHPHMLCLGRN